MTPLRNLQEFPERLRGGAVAIGNFDGVHLGHARLVERLRAMAALVGGPAVVFTFDPSPTRVLRPGAAPEPLLWLGRKVEILSELGADAVFAYPTDKHFLEMDAREFFDEVVRNGLSARAMVEGPNFFFGRNRSGNVDVLRHFCDGAAMPFEVVKSVELEGQIVSSSRVRSLVMAGKLEDARSMLGRPYRIRGTVVRGAGRGATIGYPTANVGQIDTLMPGMGIYAARALAGNRWHPAAVSLGPNPTFGEGATKVEVYIIGFQGDIYGQPIEVDFLARLRDIERFDSVDTLVAQMARDVERAIEVSH
jgi:riboflavin kinase / FMN adenylyltransferase